MNANWLVIAQIVVAFSKVWHIVSFTSRLRGWNPPKVSAVCRAWIHPSQGRVGFFKVNAWAFIVALCILSYLAHYDILDAVWHSVDNDSNCLLSRFGQRYRVVGKQIEGGGLLVAGAAAQTWPHLAVEKEKENWPVALKGVGPGFYSQFSKVATLWFRIGNVRLLLPKIEFFVESVDHKSEILLAVLLVKATELLIALS